MEKEQKLVEMLKKLEALNKPDSTAKGKAMMKAISQVNFIAAYYSYAVGDCSPSYIAVNCVIVDV